MKFIQAILLLIVLSLSARGQAVKVTAGAIKSAPSAPSSCAPNSVRSVNGSLYLGKTDGTCQLVGGGAAANVTVGTSVITGGTTTRVLYNNAGVLGEYAITGTGNVVMSASPTLTGTTSLVNQTNSGTIVQTNNSGTIAAFGRQGATNPAFAVVTSGGSDVTGISVTAAAAASGAAITVTSSGTTETLFLAGKGGPTYDVAIGTSASAAGSGGLYARYIATDNGGSNLASSGAVRFPNNSGVQSRNAGNSANVILLRLNTSDVAEIQAPLRIGPSDAASVTNQSITTQNARGGTDTNTVGASLTIQAGIGTGTATPASLLLKSTIQAASGTTAQTPATGLEIVNGTARLSNYTVATLPDAATSGIGAMAMVTDESVLTAATGIGQTPTGGGSTKVVVYSDGSVWRIL